MDHSVTSWKLRSMAWIIFIQLLTYIFQNWMLDIIQGTHVTHFSDFQDCLCSMRTSNNKFNSITCFHLFYIEQSLIFLCVILSLEMLFSHRLPGRHPLVFFDKGPFKYYVIGHRGRWVKIWFCMIRVGGAGISQNMIVYDAGGGVRAYLILLGEYWRIFGVDRSK